MEWFRWWHGTVNDPKFKVVARSAETDVSRVISVWASLLEHASEKRNTCNADETHGNVTCFDSESCDINLGFDDGLTRKILDQMEVKNIIKDGYIVNWSSSQLKREDSSAERVREHRARKKKADVTQCNADVTQCNARTEQNRTEHIRKEKEIDNSLIGFPTDASQCQYLGEFVKAEGTAGISESGLSLRSRSVSVETAVGLPVAIAQPTPPDFFLKRETPDDSISTRGSRALSLKTSRLCDEDWLVNLSKNSCYDGINVKEQYGRMVVWCGLYNKQVTKRRFVSWLNRQDKSFQVSVAPGNGNGNGTTAFKPRQPGESDEDYAIRKTYYESKHVGGIP